MREVEPPPGWRRRPVSRFGNPDAFGSVPRAESVADFDGNEEHESKDDEREDDGGHGVGIILSNESEFWQTK